MDRYVSILKQAEGNELPNTIRNDDPIIYQCLQDLINAGFLTGSLEETATESTIVNVSITESGQHFLNEYIRQHNGGDEGWPTWFWVSGAAVIVLAVVLILSFIY